MNIALIIAGGVGSRTGQEIPKQFLTVNDKPILVYTLENIQKNGCIDKIVIVASKGWEDFVLSYAKQFGIGKLDKIVIGGATRHESIHNGLKYIFENYSDKDIVAISDAVRPLVPQEIYKKAINSVLTTGSFSIAVEKCSDSMYNSECGSQVTSVMDRSTLYKGQAPECGNVLMLKEIYQLAEKNNVKNLTTTELCLKYNMAVNIINGSAKSFKITTKEDIEVFKALLNAKTSNLI